MKYYVGYFNKPWDTSEFTVICGCPSQFAAIFILEQYKEHSEFSINYQMLTAAELMDIKLVF